MKHSILLLEDDIQLHATMERFLTLSGYEVYSAYDGDIAEEILYENQIDLMLLDVKTPGQSGFELLASLRAKGDDTPAIFVTSLNSVDDVQRAFELGCVDYIRKPFALKELLVRMESILKRIYATTLEQIEIDDGLIFDTKNMTLHHHDKRIPLKTKELKLLSLFLNNPNEMLTYEKILDTLWEYEEEPSHGSLRTYIRRLRIAIGKDRIETLKQIGYRYVK